MLFGAPRGSDGVFFFFWQAGLADVEWQNPGEDLLPRAPRRRGQCDFIRVPGLVDMSAPPQGKALVVPLSPETQIL